MKTTSLPMMLLFSALPVVAAVAGALAGEPVLRGTVTSGGLPIPGALITAASGDRKVVTGTDEYGKFSFEDLAPGTWTV